MSPLLLAYAEVPTLNIPEAPSELVYCSQQNLSVVRSTNEPAITLGSLETETFTKTFGEGSDTDRSMDPTNYRRLETSTGTRTRQEVSDDDRQGFTNIRNLLDTATMTLVQQEVSDCD